MTTPGCLVCGVSDGQLWRATYRGAPPEGVPLHPKCTKAFFADLEFYAKEVAQIRAAAGQIPRA